MRKFFCKVGNALKSKAGIITISCVLVVGLLLAIILPIAMRPKKFDYNFAFNADTKYSNELSVGLAVDEFVGIEGLSSADYTMVEGKLYFNPEYLLGLESGEHHTSIKTVGRDYTLKIINITPNATYRLPNGGFETGDLSCWEASSVFKKEDAVQAFTLGGIKPNNKIYVDLYGYDGDGKYVYGFDDGVLADEYNLWSEKQGVLKSKSFVLGGSGYVSYKLGGSSNSNVCYIRFVGLDGTEYARYYNQSGSSDVGRLVQYTADLRQYIGKSMSVEICDYGSYAGDFVTFDSFETFHDAKPQGIIATDIKPLAIEAKDTIYNGDFSQGLDGWTIFGRGFIVTKDNVLKTNEGGDSAKGMLRSLPFKVTEGGILSYSMGGGSGVMYDKLTYISVKQVSTNREIYRASNVRANGNDMIDYYMDLTDYVGESIYIEICDNSASVWGMIAISNIKSTAKLEDMKPQTLAKNLLF